MTTEYIFAKPKYVEGVGYIYPVKLKDWDEFDKYKNILLYSKKQWNPNLSDEELNQVNLLQMLILRYDGERIYIDEDVVNYLLQIFKIVLRKDNINFDVIGEDFWFEIDEFHSVNKENFEVVRKVIMKQNLLFEPKFYKNPLLQKKLEQKINLLQKNSPNITLEDKISTIAAFNGKHYWDLQEYTIYQIEIEFKRICSIKTYDTSSHLFARDYVDPKDIKIDHFSENLEMLKSPYESLNLLKKKEQLNITKSIKDS